jgi:hypothetical protein
MGCISWLKSDRDPSHEGDAACQMVWHTVLVQAKGLGLGLAGRGGPAQSLIQPCQHARVQEADTHKTNRTYLAGLAEALAISPAGLVEGGGPGPERRDCLPSEEGGTRLHSRGRGCSCTGPPTTAAAGGGPRPPASSAIRGKIGSAYASISLMS